MAATRDEGDNKSADKFLRGGPAREGIGKTRDFGNDVGTCGNLSVKPDLAQC